MTDKAGCSELHRRGFLGGSMAAGLALVGVGAVAAATGAQAASLTEAQRAALSPDQVVQAMLDGNARFLSGVHRQRDFLAEMRASAAGQFPAAIVLSCVDSRAPVEVVCDLGIGDTFNARVAGNAVNDDILGSMEFACAAAGAKAVVVMGHTACGAIKGAIDNVVLGNLTLLTPPANQAASNGSFDSKRVRLQDSLLNMNALILQESGWDEVTIRRRGEYLATLAAKLWPAP